MRLRLILYILTLLFIFSCGSKKQIVVSYHKGYPQYEGQSWVRNLSKPYRVTKGLDNKHVAVTASHGIYFNTQKDKWEWQRPFMNGTREDIFTRTIVVPYLIPMLENAGANVFTSRERDEQTQEIIVSGGKEYNIFESWTQCPVRGFADTKAYYTDSDHPFENGMTKMVKAHKKKKCELQFVPQIQKAGRYAVYVSYPKYKNQNVPDAKYTVCHGGVCTEFTVNQQMGQGTWVYLGSFHFEQGKPANNYVSLSNQSQFKGYVTAGAVRFGGGMGRTLRGGVVSGEPRCLEAARYSAQWYGAPDEVWNTFKHENDYNDDIRTRPLMANWLAGGSCFNPNENGLSVPLELCLSVHSDAGKTPDDSYIGTLSICTTNHNNGRLASGASRDVSKMLAYNLQRNILVDISNKYGRWQSRGTWDKNYGETRLPAMPSAIVETMSHENPADMSKGHDPQFRFTLARSMYKTILRFLAVQHGLMTVVQPLPPTSMNAFMLNDGRLQVQWEGQPDITEPTAEPASYVLYIATNTGDFDNGQLVRSNAIAFVPKPNTIYSFKVTAVNEGGESLPAYAVFYP
ncbi:MAG: N-acetylmuramoyl-L-alanine amidase [Bacteroidaceae bacterium]|nr:N-acetylmuramoyl-L-alanine amidase [Bacteroidaceae bacterium]